MLAPIFVTGTGLRMLLVEASTVHGCTFTHEKPKRLSAEIVHALQPHLRAAL